MFSTQFINTVNWLELRLFYSTWIRLLIYIRDTKGEKNSENRCEWEFACACVCYDCVYVFANVSFEEFIAIKFGLFN